jgi:hypothetical membrane protein
VRLESTRGLALCGILVPVVFTIFVVVESLLRPGYSQISGAISDLGVGSDAILQDINFWLTGSLLIAFAAGLSSGLRAGGRAARVAPVLVGVAGVAIFLAGVFPEAFGQPLAQNATPPLYPSDIHYAVSIVAFILLLAATFVTWRAQRNDPRWGRSSSISLAFGILLLVTFFLMNLPPSLAGLAERLFVGSAFLWVGVTAGRLFSAREGPSLPAGRGGSDPDQRDPG